MKYSTTILVNLATIIFALVVVWVYAREMFEWVALLLALYFLWVVVKFILQKRRKN